MENRAAVAIIGLKLQHSAATLHAYAAWHDYNMAGAEYSDAGDFYLRAAIAAEKELARIERIAKVCGVAL